MLTRSFFSRADFVNVRTQREQGKHDGGIAVEYNERGIGRPNIGKKASVA